MRSFGPARHVARARVSLRGVLLALLVSLPAVAQNYGPVYRVSAFELEYALDHPEQIPVEELLDLEVGLRRTEDVFSAPRPVDRTVRMRLSSLPRSGFFAASAIQHINQHIVSTFNRRGINGVIVAVPEIEEGSGRDLRPPGRTALTLRVWTGRIERVTTVADGERFGGLPTDARTDLAAHEWIRERSPVRPGGERGLLRIRELEDYAAKLSRHPSRRVSVELEPGSRPGTTAVNLRVAEAKPWFVYSQVSNTGTESTSHWRQRFGLSHSQLTGRDDRLSVDYITGNFDEVHAFVGSYEAPFTLAAPDWRWRIAGSYYEYDASQVGFSDGLFKGESAYAEGSIRYRAFQYRQLFIDLDAGLRWQRVETDNRFLAGQDAEDDFLLPRVGLRAQRRTQTSTLLFASDVRWSLPELAGTDRDEIRFLGNEDPSRRFVTLTWDASYSFYLEPLIDPQAWEDPSTPSSSTLAHEVALLFRGQWSFGNRLVSQFQQVAGGLYTVRGYKQSEAAGDDLFLGSAEYRLHVPRLFAPDPTPPEVPGMGEFRARPQHVYGRPDWDLVVRVFGDAARLHVSDRKAFEEHETLASVGGGLELQFLRNLSVKLDAGQVLNTVDGSEAGDTRLHFMTTLLY